MAGVTLRPFQEECLANLSSGKVLTVGTGGGKSLMALYWYVSKNCKYKKSHNQAGELFQLKKGSPDLYIITTAKKRDSREWDGELARYALHVGDNGSHMGCVHIVVDSWNNVTKYVDVRNAVFIFDEQHAIGSGSWSKAFIKIAKANHWIILSATPGDDWSDWCPVFIADGFHRNRTEFFRRHAVYSRYAKYPRVEKWIDTDYLERCRKAVMVYHDVPRSTEPIPHEITCGYPKDIYKKAIKERWNPDTEEPFLNASELCFYLRRLVNTDVSRLDYAFHICKAHPRVIIFYSLKAEMEQILKLEKLTGIKVFQYNGDVHDDIPTKGSWIYAVQYNSGSEAWNCITTNTMLYWSLPYSYKQMVQAAGRIDRLNTPYKELHYYYMRSFAPIDISILRALRNKSKFNERAFVKSFDSKKS